MPFVRVELIQRMLYIVSRLDLDMQIERLLLPHPTWIVADQQHIEIRVNDLNAIMSHDQQQHQQLSDAAAGLWPIQPIQ